MIKKVYIDDDRFPKSDGWVIVRDFDEFKNWILLNGIPDEISFDHDLGQNKDGTIKKNGVDCARWLCNYCMDISVPLPHWNIHSANTVGRENIESVLKTYQKIFNYE